MKKFLFTLATLLMAGSMFAGENYFYMDNITLTKEEAANGCYKVVNVKAHFDEAVSAWQADFILPEGVTIGTQAKGSDLTLSFLGQFEDEETLETYYQETTFTPEIGTNGTKTRVIISVGTVKEYDEAHHGYGVCWRPGDYEQMWRVRFEFPAGFKGGDIVLHSEASCSKGIWPGLTPCELNPVNKTTEVRIKADTPEIAVTGDDYSKTVTITAEEGATIYYSTDGEIYQVYNAPIVFDEEGTYKVYAYAEGPGEGVERKSKSDVAVSDEFTIIEQEQQEPAPVATITNEGNVVTAAVPNEAAGTHAVELYVLDPETNEYEKVDNPYTVPQTYDEQTLTFKAKTIANEGESEDTWSDPKEITIPAKEKDYAPVPVFREADGKVYAEREGYTVVLMIGDEVVDNPYTLPEATYENQVITFTAYTKKNSEYYDSQTVEYTTTVEAKEKDYAPEPTIALIDDNKKVQATAPEGYTVVMMLEGAECANPYTLPDASTEQETVLNFSAYTVKKTEYGNSETVPYTVTIAIKPTITFTPVENGVKVNILNFTEYTIKVNGTTVDSRAGSGELVIEKGDVDKVIDVYAKNAPEGRVPAEATGQYTLTKNNVLELPNPTIDVNNDAENQTTIITIEVPEDAPEGTVLNYTLTDQDGNVIPETDYTVAATDSKIVITIPNGNETAFVTVTATTTLNDEDVPEDVDVVEPGEATKTVEVPQYQKTAAPIIDVSFAGEEGHYYANVTFKNDPADPNAVIEYCLGDPTVEENWLPYTGAPVVITEDGSHTVYARATATGKATSEVADRTFELNQTATSVNELVNGKTVAGVRYFNMAGQEMQEANGITIVVTTYTDGTTSAVKVMK